MQMFPLRLPFVLPTIVQQVEGRILETLFHSLRQASKIIQTMVTAVFILWPVAWCPYCSALTRLNAQDDNGKLRQIRHLW